MLEKRVVDARLRKLDGCVAELKGLRKVQLKLFLEDRRTQALAERYFQVAIQSCMDIANYIIARKRLQILRIVLKIAKDQKNGASASHC